MRKKLLWAGIDLGVESASICVIDDAGEVLHQGTCASCAKEVRRELTQFRKNRYASVGIEAGTATHVARGLRSMGYPVELYEVRRLSKFLRVRRNKTDAGDARGIAEAGLIGASVVSKVYLKSLASQSLQSCLAIRRHLIAQRVAASNMLARQIEHFGGRLRCKPQSSKLRSLADCEIRKYFGSESGNVAVQLRYLAAHCEQLISFQRAMDRQLEQQAQQNEVCRLLMEIPGVGPLCALTFYAAVDDPYRFVPTTNVGSYFGLAPRLHQSGLTSRKTRISKMGNKSVRSLLVHAAGLFMRYAPADAVLRLWARDIESRRGRLPSRVALARKLAVIMLTIWKSRTHFEFLNSPIAEPQAASAAALTSQSQRVRSEAVEFA